MIETIYGSMQEDILDKRSGTEDYAEYILNWVEYWYKDEVVHRSVALHFKYGINLISETTQEL